MAIRNRFAELHDEITTWRRDLHQNPEILFDTVRTSEIVANKLREFGCDEVAVGIGRTGVVGTIKGNADNSGKVIGLRADMDALPILEDTGLEYASKSAGKMHACGHDGHTSMLLGAAKYLTETRNFNGKAAVIFQPAEEGGAGGKEMVDDGMMERFGIDEVYGMHNMPGMEVGEFAIRPGPLLAAVDKFTISVEGHGGHAAEPHRITDTTLAASHVVVALQSIVSRNCNPQKPLVVSVTSFRTNSDTFNVIPQNVEIKGAIRTLDEETREMVKQRMNDVAKSTAAAFGAEAKTLLFDGCPSTVNAENETRFAAEAAIKVAGKVDADPPISMASEDFSFMLNARPGAFMLIGNGDSKGLHNPGYDFNDEAMLAGCSWWVELVESRMASN